MRIAVHDFAGHPFTIQLSRELARRGHEVLHAYSGSFINPKGDMKARREDGRLQIRELIVPGGIDRLNYIKRRQGEIAHGRLLVKALDEFGPEVVLCGNTGLDIIAQTQHWCRSADARFIFWVQDLIGRAAQRILRDRIPVLGGIAGDGLAKFERRLLRASDGVIVIADAFLPHLPPGAGPVTVIENWGVRDEMPLRPQDNPWTRKHGLAGKRCIAYSGTLGRKHNPELLIRLAEEFRSDPEVRVVVITSDDMIGFLQGRAEAMKLENMVILPYQPFADLPDVLGGAEVLAAILEADAGVFSVPSKVLSYLCAGRPILLAVPGENLAAQIVLREGAGLASEPAEEAQFIANARRLMSDSALRERCGAGARAYAERAFDIRQIALRFEEALAEPHRTSHRIGA